MPQASDADHASGSEDRAGQKQGGLEAAKEGRTCRVEQVLPGRRGDQVSLAARDISSEP